MKCASRPASGPAASKRFLDLLHGVAEVAVAGLILGPAGRMNAGLAVQRIDTEAAVVGQGGQAGKVGGGAGLELGVGDKAGAGLLGLGQVEFGGAEALDAERRDQSADFAQLALVVGGDDQLRPDRVHRPQAFNCAAKMSPQPIRARRSRRSRPFFVERRALGGKLCLDDGAVGGEDEIAVAAGVESSR